MQRLFNLNPLSLFKLVLLLKGIVGDDLVIHAIVQLAIIIEFVLAVDLTALLREA